jgi:hypothetical protein
MITEMGLKISGVAAVAALAFISLCPANWVPHTVLNFGLEHFLAFFVVTLILCLAWPQRLLVGAVLAAIGMLL